MATAVLPPVPSEVPMLDEDVKHLDSDHHDLRPDGSEPFVYDQAMEKRLTWKVDLRMVPMLWLMYVLNSLDRNNIGNARTAGMQRDLELSDTDFSNAITVFYAAYLVLGVPSNMILARVRPRLYLSLILCLWGAITIAYVGVKNKAGLYGLRILLGVAESGFYPGALLLLSSWYRKSDLAKRYCLLYSATLVSGAFSGLLTGALLKGLDGAHGIPAWKWLFLVEGVITVGVSFFAIFVLPDYPVNTSWLSPEERAYAVARLANDGGEDEGAAQISAWRAFVMTVRDYRLWLLILAMMCTYASGTVTFFIPTIMLSLGYAGVTSQLMTVPVYVVGAIGVVGSNFASDRYKERLWFIIGGSAFAVFSGIICATVPNYGAKYAFLAFYSTGAWAVSPLLLSYTSNLFHKPKEKRAIALGLVNSFGNLASIYGAYIWPTSSKPKYIPGFTSVTCFMFTVCVVAIIAKTQFSKYTPKEERQARAVNQPAQHVTDA